MAKHAHRIVRMRDGAIECDGQDREVLTVNLMVQ